MNPFSRLGLRLAALLVVAMALSACGGGGGSPGVCQPACPVAPPTTGSGGTSSTDTGTGTGTGSSTGSNTNDTTGSGVAGGGDSTGTGGNGTGSSGSGSSGTGSSGTGSSGTGSSGSGTSGSGTSGTGVADGSGVGSGGTGVSDGTGVAGGVGSGGTGISGDGGVGSGGTGATASAVGIGSVDGFGSIIVNGVRHEIGSATLTVSDAASLQLGVTVRVVGTVSADLSSGTATSVVSAADMRGIVSGLNAASLSFTVMGQTVTADDATIFNGVGSLASLANGDIVQVYGLPGAAGELRATRIEKLTVVGNYVLSGLVQNLDTAARTFRLGTVTVQYSAGALVSPLTAATLANGMVVRVNSGAEPVGGVLTATQVQAWYSLPGTTGAMANVTGMVTDYTSLSSFKLQGTSVNASGAQITGGPSSSIGNGVKVEVSGTVSGGVLVATKLRIRYVPGTGGPVSFSATGAVSQFTSSSNFRVQGQLVNASGAGVVFTGGTVGDLANGKRVTVLGSQVVGGVLIAQSVTFN